MEVGQRARTTECSFTLCVPDSLYTSTLGFVIAGELNARFGISFRIELERTLSVLAVMLSYPTAVTSIPLLGAIIEKNLQFTDCGAR